MTCVACRSFNEPADDITTKLCTVFTLCNWDTVNYATVYWVGSQLLNFTAQNVLTSIKLEKITVETLINKLNENTEMHSRLISLLSLYI